MNIYKNTNCYCTYFLSILFISQQNMWCFLTEHFSKFEQHLCIYFFFKKSNVQHSLKSSYSLSSYYLKHMSCVLYSYYLLFLLHFRLLFQIHHRYTDLKRITRNIMTSLYPEQINLTMILGISMLIFRLMQFTILML